MTGPDSSRLDRGMATRRKVLGDAYVDRATADNWRFAIDFQRFITEFGWDGVWNRPGLSHRDRSLVNLGLLAGTNRSAELETHVKAAVNNGVTPEEITEIFIQVTAYCGIPAGVECFRIARKAFAELGID